MRYASLAKVTLHAYMHVSHTMSRNSCYLILFKTRAILFCLISSIRAILFLFTTRAISFFYVYMHYMSHNSGILFVSIVFFGGCPRKF